MLYLCYTRFTHRPTLDNARRDRARCCSTTAPNPNDFYMAGDSEYSALVGVAGEGEQDSPRQPYAEALYRLLLERGAGPVRHPGALQHALHGRHALVAGADLPALARRLGRKADWDDPDWSMLDMGGYGSGALLRARHRDEEERPRARRVGADARRQPERRRLLASEVQAEAHRCYDEAVVQGLDGDGGAAPAATARRRASPRSNRRRRSSPRACGSIARPRGRCSSGIRSTGTRHRAMFEAAKRDRPDVLALLLDLGVSLEIADEHNTRALHHAAGANALRAATFLIERGAEIDPREIELRRDADRLGRARRSHGDGRLPEPIHPERLDAHVQRLRRSRARGPARGAGPREARPTRTAARRSGGCRTTTRRRWRSWSCCCRTARIRPPAAKRAPLPPTGRQARHAGRRAEAAECLPSRGGSYES